MKKVLVANRGEIALRIINSLRKMHIKSVAVYSEADKNSLHVRAADEAYLIGPAPSSESYLVMEKIIEVALSTKVEGIHPGYGFLSENAIFAEKVTAAGIKFIGPSPHSIRIMGSKLAAKDAVKKFNIPLVPGTDTPLTDVQEAKEIARDIGYPILIKASAGGGGKGMRLVNSESEFDEALSLAQNEAQSAFGDNAVFIEKFISSPRHIEVQVLFDSHGKGVHLFERECSVQRRHQKVLEEAPSAKINSTKRMEMGKIALDVARSCNYEGAGTVEFIMDETGHYYFLEMNTRLQVEHPITEMITGVDLVEQQIRVARGEALSINQDDLKITGHAIELRIYAENPYENFSPSIGHLKRYKIPTGEGIRVDNGMEEGMDVPIYYDPMIAKLVAYGENRNDAILKLRKAINQYDIEGIESTLSYGDYILSNNEFIDGSYDTHFVSKYHDDFLADNHKKELNNFAAKFVGLHWEDYLKVVKLPN